MQTDLLASALRARLERAPDQPFAKCGSEWITHAQLHDTSDRVGAGLQGLGVAKGDRVALLAPNRVELIELHAACAKRGVIQVPLNYWLKGDPLRHQLRDSGAVVLVADPSGCRAVRDLLAQTAVRHVVRLDDTDAEPVPCATSPYGELRAAEPLPAHVDLHEGDPISIIYTSGTTGPAKGCTLSNRYYVTIGRAFGTAKLVISGDRIFTSWPLFHTSGHVIALTSALVNEASVCIEPQFSASRFISRAAAERATALFGVGPMAAAILAQPPRSTDGSHQFRVSAWTPLSPEQQLEFERRFNTPVVSEIYGQTECFPVSISALDGPRRRESAGRPLPHLDVSILDDHGKEAPVGTTGEIVVRPRQPHTIFSGYWRELSRHGPPEHEGWHHTGDNGFVDDAGFLTFVDRKKDSLRRRGENIASSELETAILRHPKIVQAAVVGTPATLGEDDIRACLVPEPGAELEPVELFEFFARTLPYFAIPRYVELRDSLPTTAATGRIMKHVLRAEALAPDAWDFDSMGLSVAKERRRA